MNILDKEQIVAGEHADKTATLEKTKNDLVVRVRHMIDCHR